MEESALRDFVLMEVKRIEEIAAFLRRGPAIPLIPLILSLADRDSEYGRLTT
jgi:hypothetical protein